MQEQQMPAVPALEFLTRRQAGRRLGLSVAMIRKLEKQGKLHGVKRPLVDANGTGTRVYRYVFREAEVEAIASTRKFVGEPVAAIRDAKVYSAFRAGKSVADVVIELQIPADVAEHLWGFYVRARNAREGAPPPAPAPPSFEELERQAEREQREHEQRLADLTLGFGPRRAARKQRAR